MGNHATLWLLRKTHPYTLKCISGIQDTFSAVRVDGKLCDWFNMIVGVLQGWILSPVMGTKLFFFSYFSTKKS